MKLKSTDSKLHDLLISKESYIDSEKQVKIIFAAESSKHIKTIMKKLEQYANKFKEIEFEYNESLILIDILKQNIQNKNEEILMSEEDLIAHKSERVEITSCNLYLSTLFRTCENRKISRGKY